MMTPSRKNVVELLRMVQRAKGRADLEDFYEMEWNLVVHAAEKKGLVKFVESYPERITEVHLTWKGEDFLSVWRWRWLRPLKILVDPIVQRIVGR